MQLTPINDLYHHMWFPLPYRILFLTGLGILGWATNMQGLDAAGVDVVSAMDLRTDTDQKPVMPVHHSSAYFQPNLHRPTYRLFFAYSGFCIASWLFFLSVTRGDAALVDKYGFIPVMTAFIVVLVLFSPYDVFSRSERYKFMMAVRRCLFSRATSPVYLSDVVLADIGTSYGRVLGDLWLSVWMLKPGNSLLMTPNIDGWLRWIAPMATSFPFFVRLRQCLIEFNLSDNESRRPLFNALKYATSFPVIFLAAAQNLVITDLMREKGNEVVGQPWHGEHPLFRLWLLAAVVNSLYSFWWDVTNDWGLNLFKLEAAKNRKRAPKALLLPRIYLNNVATSRDSSLDGDYSDIRYPPTHRDASRYPYRQSCSGLRPTVLYPRAVYPALVFVNFVLRLVWTAKLSTHFYTARDGSLVFFWLEVAEVLRRWLWVFLRIEWEVVRKLQEDSQPLHLDQDGRDESDSFEMVAAVSEKDS